MTTSRRDQEGKGTVLITELTSAIPKLLEQIQSDMFDKAAAEYKEHRVQISKWEDFVPALNKKNVCIIPHCLGSACEDTIKDKSKRIAQTDDSPEDSRAPSMGAKSLCIPDAQPDGGIAEGTKCLNPDCGEKAKTYVMFGRSY